ncbi:hypothetical protein KL939_001813 [Ogataea angusta]|nr:hypothetical protein KL939_001813 [Ogataea angusta]
MDLESVESVEFTKINTELEGERYIQLNVQNTPEWIHYVCELVKKSDALGIVTILDCAYQFGSPNIVNSGLHQIKKKLQKNHSDTEIRDLLERVVVFDDFENLGDVNKLLNTILEVIPTQFQDRPLNCILVSNTSIFYWNLRDMENFDDLAELHRICRQLSSRLGCYVVSSRSLFE